MMAENKKFAVKPSMARENMNYGKTDRSRSFSLTGWLFRFLFSLIGLFVLAGMIMGGVGVLSYYIVRTKVQGKTVNVPMVVDKSVYDALSELNRNGLYMELKGTEQDSQAPAGIVLNQSPAPHTPVKMNTPVRVTVSSGPVSVHIPDVKGITYKEAQIKIEQSELKLGRSSLIESDRIPAEMVISTDPPAGAAAVKGGAVNLLVSSGRPRLEISMPRLIAKSETEAQDMLSSLGLKMELRALADPAVPQGIIIDQDPPAGVRIDNATEIILTVSSGPAG